MISKRRENEVEDNKTIIIYDSTLRDGAQAGGISYTLEDKLKIVERLDKFGVKFIEAGNPGSNIKDQEFFARVKKMKLKNATLIAFGSTRRVGIDVKDDPNIQSLIAADTEAVAIFGKSWDFHVKEVLKTTEDENLQMIYDTIKYLKSLGKYVVFDAEHFFDGYKNNRKYALETLKVAKEAGADSLDLCDTNGGTFPMDIYNITKEVVEMFPGTLIGIHCHNDTGMAVANSIMAVLAGARQVQGTINGYGERCGNADLITLIPNLQLKLGFKCVPDENIKHLTSLSRYVAEIANMIPNERAPYVGAYAFTHKAGMHIDAVKKNPASFEHINPEIVGNTRRIVLSEVAGRATILDKIREIDPTVTKDSPVTKEIIDELKRLENEGYQFESAEASFEMLIRKKLGLYQPFFTLKEFKVLINEPAVEYSSSAIVKIAVDGVTAITAAEGDGPVHALDSALRKALEKFYPELKEVHLVDYKVRVLNAETATAAKVRVLIESTDGKDTWTTVGVSTDIVNASWIALVDSLEYKLCKEKVGK